MIENIFNYKPDTIEKEILNLQGIEIETYLNNTPELKILSDLHLLFLIRKDKENCWRIIGKIRNYDEGFEMRTVIIK